MEDGLKTAFETLPHSLSDVELSQMMVEKWKSVLELIDSNPGGEWMDMAHKVYPKLSQFSMAAQEHLREGLDGKPLIDLGCGVVPFNFAKSLVKKYNIAKYTGVDIDTSAKKLRLGSVPFEVVESEILGYLCSVPPESSCVMSSGLLCSEMIGGDGSQESREYLERLFEHITRILPKDGVLVTMHFDLDVFAKSAGLVLDSTFSDDYLKIWKKG